MASSGCRVLVWNINSLVPTVRNAVLKYGSWRGFFDDHGIDIACLQESKIIDEKLTKELVCVEGYQSFWAISREKKGYSGVTTYVSEAYAPLSCKADCLGGGGGDDDLDREGRVVVTDHQHFVLVNVYAPNAGDRPDRSRLPFKLRWLAALKRKVDALAAAGREVLVVGDFNVPAEPRDIHPTLGSYEEIYSREEQAALKALTDSYTDVWRRLHPEESSTYTVWSEKTSARAFNQGLRIDYVLCTPGLLGRVVSCEILSSEVLPPKWSDHAGILLELRDTPLLPHHPPCQHWQRLHRRFNPPNRIASLFAGKKRQAAGDASSAAPPAAATAADGRRLAAGNIKDAGAPEAVAKEEERGAGEAEQQKKARHGGGLPPSSGVAGGSQQSSQLAGSQEAEALPAEPAQAQQSQQQAKGSSSINMKPGKGGGKLGKQQQQQLDVGQQNIGMFFSKK
ncbi:hypothetical protein ABPG77_007377 [Micractinium sp. CCAP 211/92]